MFFITWHTIGNYACNYQFYKVMFWNYLKLAVRNLYKQGLRTLINILGLGFGIAVCILIYMFTTMELSFNQFHENKDQIYRVYNRLVRANGESGVSPFQPARSSVTSLSVPTFP